MMGAGRRAAPIIALVLALALSAASGAAQPADTGPGVAAEPPAAAGDAPRGGSLEIAAGAAVGVLIGVAIFVVLIGSASD